MNYDVYVKIDLQDAFYNLTPSEKIGFIKYNLGVLDYDYLLEYLKDKGYNITNKQNK